MQTYEELEVAWAEFNGLDPAGMVVCSSGSSALHLAATIAPGQARWPSRPPVAIMPDYTMVACPRAAAMAGMIPVFMDCGDDLLSTDRDIRETNPAFRNTRVFMPVHIYGRQVDIGIFVGVARVLGAAVIEDMSEIHGVNPHPDTDAACWSFYLNKIIAGEEGGAVYFRDPEKAILARSLRSMGFTDAHDFMHVPGGFNYRMSNAHAGLVLCSLRDYPTMLAGRRYNESVYDSLVPLEWQMPPRAAPWVYDIRLPFPDMVDEVVRAIPGARHGFKPMRMQPEFLEAGYRDTNAFRMSQQIMYLPLGPEIHKNRICEMVETLKRTIGA